MTSDRPSNLPWPPVLLVFAVLAPWLLNRFVPLNWPGLDDGPARLVGLGFAVVGLTLLFWAVRTLRHHDTTIMPHRASRALVTDGPFAWCRNPIYLSDVFLLLALADWTKNIWFIVAALGFAMLVTWLAIVPEEAHLEARFGDAYRNYKATTRRWI